MSKKQLLKRKLIQALAIRKALRARIHHPTPAIKPKSYAALKQTQKPKQDYKKKEIANLEQQEQL